MYQHCHISVCRAMLLAALQFSTRLWYFLGSSRPIAVVVVGKPSLPGPTARLPTTWWTFLSKRVVQRGSTKSLRLPRVPMVPGWRPGAYIEGDVYCLSGTSNNSTEVEDGQTPPQLERRASHGLALHLSADSVTWRCGQAFWKSCYSPHYRTPRTHWSIGNPVAFNLK